MQRKGSYVLLLHLPQSQHITIGKKGRVHFTRGYYAYVGSALNGLDRRIQRHKSLKKKMHWHIDYLLDHAQLQEVYVKENSDKEECNIARGFAQQLPSIKGFGCSDCDCSSHLFYGEQDQLLTLINKVEMRKMGDQSLV